MWKMPNRSSSGKMLGRVHSTAVSGDGLEMVYDLVFPVLAFELYHLFRNTIHFAIWFWR